MNKELNLLYLKDTNKLLLDEDLKYFVLEDNDKITINPLPIIYLKNLKIIYPCLAYDYDSLNSKNQEKYKFHFKSYEHVENNKYNVKTKTYKKNNH